MDLFIDDTDARDHGSAALSKERTLQNGSLEEDDDEEEKKENEKDEPKGNGRTMGTKKSLEKKRSAEETQKQKRKFSRLSMLRRRRCAHKEDESDLSEGFESDEEEDEEGGGPVDGLGAARVQMNSSGREGQRGPLPEDGSWETGSEEDEGGTAFDVETDSDMNSQESRSDLEDMEDAEHAPQQQQQQQEEDEQPQPSREENSTPPVTNGPIASNDASISSNLQAMSSQLFQAKRCFRLAPTFSNVLLRPAAATNPAPDSNPAPVQEATLPAEEISRNINPEIANGTNDNGTLLTSKWFWVFSN